jgi:hypothetical protein
MTLFGPTVLSNQRKSSSHPMHCKEEWSWYHHCSQPFFLYCSYNNTWSPELKATVSLSTMYCFSTAYFFGHFSLFIKTLHLWAGRVVQVVACLPSKPEVLSSNTSTHKKKDFTPNQSSSPPQSFTFNNWPLFFGRFITKKILLHSHHLFNIKSSQLVLSSVRCLVQCWTLAWSKVYTLYCFK